MNTDQITKEQQDLIDCFTANVSVLTVELFDKLETVNEIETVFINEDSGQIYKIVITKVI
jgi:hypothetical protein